MAVLKMCLIGVVFSLCLNVMLVLAGPRQRNAVCETEACKSTAQRMLDYMDPSVNPCDDFYQFACGNYIKTKEFANEDNEDATEENIFTELFEKVQTQLRNILWEDPVKLPEPRPYQLLRQLFYTCKKEGSLFKRGIKPYKQLMDRAGGWPLLDDNWVDSHWSLQDIEVRLRQLGIGGNFLFKIITVQDYDNCKKLILTVDQPKLGLDRELLVKGMTSPEVQEYQQIMYQYVRVFGINPSKVKTQLRQMLLFEMELAKIETPEEERSEHKRLNNLFTVEQLSERVDWLDWDSLLRGILPMNMQWDEEELIRVNEPEYFDRLRALLDRYPQKTVVNYIMWRAAMKMFTSLTLEIRDPTSEIRKQIEICGATDAEEVDAWEYYCVQEASSVSLALASLYVNKYFDELAKEEANEIIKGLQEEMSINIHQLSWMDGRTKSRAQDKVMKMESIVGYTKELANITKLEILYSGLKMNKQNFLDAVLDVVKWYHTQELERLHSTFSRKDWFSYGALSTVVNAFYNPQGNIIMLPAAIMQSPLFGAGLPKYFNYARLGTLLGHELTHGFDDQGSQFDANGNLNNWWEKSSQQKFEDRMKCLVNQYNNFHVSGSDDIHFNGAITQGENVADMGGLKLAYQAYRSQSSTKEPSLPGLQEYSSQQLFMLSFANMWCSYMPDSAVRSHAASDPHPLPQYRVNGVLSDWPEFSKLFQCAPNSPMNPKKKCTVW